MISLHSRYRLKFENGGRLTMTKSHIYRIGYFLVFIVLLFSFLISFNPDQDLRGGRLTGAVVIFLLMITALLISALSRNIVFEKKGKRAVFYFGIFSSIPRTQFRVRNLGPIDAVVLRRIALVNLPKKNTTGFMSRFNRNLEIRARISRLTLEIPGGTHMLEESSGKAALEAMGKAIAGHLEIPFRVEEI